MLQTFVIHVENKPGVLNRIASLFRRRAFNIESLTVGHSDKPGVSRMTISLHADENTAARIEAHLYKLVNVLHVQNVTHVPNVVRELAMIKIAANNDNRVGVMQIATTFRARVVDVAPESLVIEVTGTEDKIDSMLEVLRPFGVMEMVRTGRVAMCRSTHTADFTQQQPRPDLSQWDDDTAAVYEA